MLQRIICKSNLLSSWNSWLLEMGPKGCPKTPVRNYHCTLCNVPEEGRSQFGWILGKRINFDKFTSGRLHENHAVVIWKSGTLTFRFMSLDRAAVVHRGGLRSEWDRMTSTFRWIWGYPFAEDCKVFVVTVWNLMGVRLGVRSECSDWTELDTPRYCLQSSMQNTRRCVSC
jgi:hypothetical protein